MKNKKLFVLLCFIAVICTLRNLFVGLEVDEEYAYTLAVKLLNGDTLFKDCFEAHQLSALLLATLLKVKRLFSSNSSYDIIYLRLCGIVIQGILSYCIYKTLKVINKDKALLVSFLWFLFTPKFSYIPDYALMQYWLMSLLVIGLLFDVAPTYLGSLSALAVLVYPGYVLLYVYLLYKKRKDIISFIMGSIVSVLGYLLLAIPNISREGLSSVSNVFQDPTHSMYLLNKLLGIIQTSYVQLICLGLVLVLLYLLKSEKSNIKNKIIKCILLGTILGTIICNCVTSSKLGFTIAFLIVLLTYENKNIKDYRVFCILMVLAHCLSSNQGKLFMLRYLVPVVILLLIYEKSNFKLKFASLWLAVVLGSIIPTHDFYVVDYKFELAYEGAASGLYISPNLNSKLKDISTLENLGDTVFYLGNDSLVYSYTDCDTLSPNVLSTPVFDISYVNYFNNTSLPESIVLDLNCNELCYVDDSIGSFIDDNYNVKSKSSNFILFSRK